MVCFLGSRQAEGPVYVRGGLQLCLQPTGDRRLDGRAERQVGQEEAFWNGCSEDGPRQQHQAPPAGPQRRVRVPLSGRCACTSRFHTETNMCLRHCASALRTFQPKQIKVHFFHAVRNALTVSQESSVSAAKTDTLTAPTRAPATLSMPTSERVDVLKLTSSPCKLTSLHVTKYQCLTFHCSGAWCLLGRVQETPTPKSVLWAFCVRCTCVAMFATAAWKRTSASSPTRSLSSRPGGCSGTRVMAWHCSGETTFNYAGM